MNKNKLKLLLKQGWMINTVTFKLPPSIRALGFEALCFIAKGDDLMGMFI